MAMGARFDGCDAVFFDIDDTLYDFHGSVRAALARLMRGHPHAFAGLEPSDVEARYWAANASMTDEVKLALIQKDPYAYRRATWALFLEREASGLAPHETLAPSRVQKFVADNASLVGDAPGDDLAGRLAHDFALHRFGNLAESAYPGALETVAELAADGTRVGIISNGPSSLQRAKFTALGLAAHVPEERVLISGEFGERKPHASIFEAALKRAGARAEEAVFIGDSVECDVACKVTGMNFIFFDAARRERPDFKSACGFEPDEVAHDYAEVRRLLGLG